MKTDGIILDIDGTLWNSTPIVAEAWNEIIEKRDDIPFRFTAKQLTQLFGRPLPVIADMVFPFLEEKERYDLINECCEREHELLRASTQNILYPGVAETMKALCKKIPLFIVSNCQNGYIEAVFEYYSLERYFTDYLCWGDTHKPKSETLKLIMQKNHCTSAVYVGDTQGDFDAASAAGIPFIHAAYGFGELTSPPAASAASVFELVKIFE